MLAGLSCWPRDYSMSSLMNASSGCSKRSLGSNVAHLLAHEQKTGTEKRAQYRPMDQGGDRHNSPEGQGGYPSLMLGSELPSKFDRIGSALSSIPGGGVPSMVRLARVWLTGPSPGALRSMSR